MAKLNTHLRKWIERISEEIEDIQDEGEVAEEGINVVYYFSGRKALHGYYRLVSKEPIFKGINGKMVTTQHLGDGYSLKACEAIASVKRRKKNKGFAETVRTYGEILGRTRKH